MKKSISKETKLNAVSEYLSGTSSMASIARKLNINSESVKKWIIKYESMGADAFFNKEKRNYSKEFKEQAVLSYLAGDGSMNDICKKFKIASKNQLHHWVKKYNGHEELKASGTGGSVNMTKGRTTSFDERIDIASYCIAHDHNYSETAEKFKVSYQQAYSYTVKYEKNGIDGLKDHRGKRKSPEDFTEIEKLKAELKMEKAKRIKAEMEVSFLKKLNEIEGRRD